MKASLAPDEASNTIALLLEADGGAQYVRVEQTALLLAMSNMIPTIDFNQSEEGKLVIRFGWKEDEE